MLSDMSVASATLNISLLNLPLIEKYISKIEFTKAADDAAAADDDDGDTARLSHNKQP